jgi:uncharacterized protein (DUF1697 family)
MNSYVALLRGINVSGHKLIKMKYLENSISSLGFSNISTYLQSGNLVFQSDNTDIGVLEDQISLKIQLDFGFDVPVFVYEKNLFLQINANNPFQDVARFDRKKIYTIFLKQEVDPISFLKIEMDPKYPEKMVLRKNIIYMYFTNGYGKTKVHNNFFENKLNAIATARNWNTVTKLTDFLEELN